MKIGMETIEKEKRKSGKDNETEEPKVRADKEMEEPKAGADKETEEGELGFGANKETEEGELSAGTDEKKQSSRRKAYLSRVAAAVVIVLLAGGIGVTSFGGPERVMEMMKRNVGSRKVEQVDSNKDNLVIKEENEEEAYQKIKDELGIEPVRLSVRPKGVKFVSAEIEKRAQIAELSYQYKNENINYVISTPQSDNSLAIDVEDNEVKHYKKKIKSVVLNVKEYETEQSKERRYAVTFNYRGGEYYLIGVIPRMVFDDILNNLHFF